MTQPTDDVSLRERADRASADLPQNSELFLKVVDAIILARDMDPLDAYLGLNMCLVKLVGDFELASVGGYNAQRFKQVLAMMHATLDTNFDTIRRALEETTHAHGAPNPKGRPAP
ncbi:MAG: hypothetical protein EOP64_00075 [Sphingomonas sp.]|nr:MAG: hypothetical protein EOP64_00075 [Sphingomonas sp.]